ncbi:hypothetical protein LEMLEM_LOCUS6274 [Lemmus lemmus]
MWSSCALDSPLPSL